jgi:hypothetical protein
MLAEILALSSQSTYMQQFMPPKNNRCILIYIICRILKHNIDHICLSTYGSACSLTRYTSAVPTYIYSVCVV